MIENESVIRIGYLNGEEKTKTVFRVFRVYRVNEKCPKYPIYPKYPRYVLEKINESFYVVSEW